jgi:hypothetical protein
MHKKYANVKKTLCKLDALLYINIRMNELCIFIN